MATGDDVRAAVFARRFVGYVPSEVNGLLALLADELDAGRSAAPLIRGESQFASFFGGYDRRAVNRLLNALSESTGKWYEHGYEKPSEPWHARYGDVPIGVSRERYQDSFAQRTDGKEYRRQCEEQWQRFPGLSGTRLSLAGAWIYGGDGKALMSCQDGRRWKVAERWTVAETGQAFDFLRDKVVDAATGNPVLWIAGIHHSHSAGTVVRTGGSRRFRFPVGGTRRSNAVMMAIDQTGEEVAWFRQVRKGTEAVMAASLPVDAAMLCVAVVAASLLDSFFADGS